MQILSHRGYWKSPEEKNLPVAFDRSFKLGFGTETDIRDLDTKLVISHDMAPAGCLTAAEMLTIHRQHDPKLPLALNVKSDGLQQALKSLLEAYEVENYFIFDMSIPDALVSLKAGLKCFTRQSEYEPEPAFYDQACGVWIDGFHEAWWSEDILARHLDAGKQVCLVSPDLHKRPHQECWEEIANWQIREHPEFMICTDFPEDATKILG